MILLAGSIMLALVLTAGIMQWRKSGGDIFHPVVVVSAMHLLRTVPYLFLVAFDSSVIHRLVYHSLPDLEEGIVWYSFVEGVGFLALLAGALNPLGWRIAERLPVLRYRFNHHQYRVATLAAFSIGMGSFLLYLYYIDGLETLLYNLHRRTEFGRGAAYLTSLISIVSFSVILVTYSRKFNRTNGQLLLLILMGMGAAFMLTARGGGRKLTLSLLLAVLMVQHYGVHRIRRIGLFIVCVAAVCIPYFVAVPLIRAAGAVEYYQSDWEALGQDIVENLARVITDLSYVDTYVFITNQFDVDNVWMGRSYLDLLKAPVPSGMLDGKPPVDDGVYIQSMANGYRVTPGMAADNLYGSSWPPETLGACYMNFWVPGVVAGMFLLGLLYQTSYQYMRRCDYSLYTIVLYHLVLFNFQFSNLRIVQTMMGAVTLTLFFVLFFRVQRAETSGLPNSPFSGGAPAGPAPAS